MQFQADILNCRIIRPQVVESTAFGVAQLAGMTIKLFKSKKDLERLHKQEKVFSPSMHSKTRNHLYQGWLKAVDRARGK
jgi:glycerol kinase